MSFYLFIYLFICVIDDDNFLLFIIFCFCLCFTSFHFGRISYCNNLFIQGFEYEIMRLPEPLPLSLPFDPHFKDINFF